MNDSLNAALPCCKNTKCFAYWDGKCSALTNTSFRGKCPFFKDKGKKHRKIFAVRKGLRNGRLRRRSGTSVSKKSYNVTSCHTFQYMTTFFSEAYEKTRKRLTFLKKV